MRILVLTVGTRGDVQPYVALGKGLTAAGHEVAICTCARLASLVTRHGLRYAHLDNDLLDFMHTEDGRIAMEHAGSVLESIRTGVRVMPRVTGILRRQVDAMWQACQDLRPELILFHPKAIGAQDFAEKLGIPCALAFYLPLYVPTGDFPVMGFPRWPRSRRYNRLTYRIVDWATRSSTSRFVKPWRAANGLPARRRTAMRALPALHAFSPTVIPRPADWPSTAAVTGYWFLDEPDPGWTPSRALLEFLAVEPAPIYVGFGSIFGRRPVETTKIVLDAVRLAGVRAIVATGWGGLDVSSMDLPETVLSIDDVPHDWLFPRVAAVVHHGGCGTTAAGLRAGRPTVVCPLFGDQGYWGDIVHRIGAGPPPVLQRRLTADRLARALREALESPGMRRSAASIGDGIRRENGVASAVAFVEATLSGRHAGSS